MVGEEVGDDVFGDAVGHFLWDIYKSGHGALWRKFGKLEHFWIGWAR